MLYEDHTYENMDQEYRSQIFRARKKLLGSIESSTILPDYGLKARDLLNSDQLDVVKNIRERKLTAVLDRFIDD